MASAVDPIAAELYAVPPKEFTAVRDARAAAAKADGDRGLAAAIGKLRRPTTSAWLVNLLVRRRGELVHGLLEIGAAMRAAQADLAADELRRLAQQRHEVITALAREARVIAREEKQPVSEAVDRELQDTLEAAFADEEAAEAVRNGRLTAALHYSGLGASGAAGAATAPPPRADRREVERELSDAQRAASDAARHEAESAERMAAAEAAYERVSRELADRQREVARLDAERQQAAARLRDEQRQHEEAERSSRRTGNRVTRAQEALDRLQSGHR